MVTIHELAWWLRAHSWVETSHDPADTVVLTGSGRSGTTWMMELMVRAGDKRPIFEPLNATYEDTGARLAFRHLRAGDHEPALERIADSFMTGRYRSGWTSHLESARRPRIYRNGRVVKCVRMTMSTDWLAARFPQAQFAHIVRHPGAVVASKLKYGWPTDGLDVMLAQPGIGDGLLADMAGFVASLDSPAARLATMWAIDNAVAFAEHAGRSELFVYEQARDSPSALIEPFRRLGLTGPIDQVDKPSKLSWVDPQTGEAVLKSAEQACSDLGGDRAEVERVVKEFGFDRYYAMDGSTDADALHTAWQRSSL